MLVIRKQQMALIREALRRAAANRMMAGASERFPVDVGMCGESQTRRLVEAAISRAASYGMVTEPGATLFLDLMFQLGVDFDHDPQLAFAARVLKDPGLSEGARVRRLARKVACYRAAVWGQEGELLMEAMGRLRHFPASWDGEPEICYTEELAWALRDLYPLKCARMGARRLHETTVFAASKAASCGMDTPAGKAVLSAMMLLGGAGVLEDPRFPGLLDVLEFTAGMEPDKRTARLRAAMERDIEWRVSRCAEALHAVG